MGRCVAALLAALIVLTLADARAADTMAQQTDQHASGLQPASWPNDALTIANLGHSTLLMNFLGVRVITDPALSERVGLSIGPLTIGPERHIAPPLSESEIPALDVILITHAHMDHLDLPTLRSLPKEAVVIACENCADLIEPLGFSDVRELKWGEQTEVKGLTVTAMGARHWGRRWPWGADRGYNSYILEKGGDRMLLACDSALTDLFAAVRGEPPEVAAFSIGAYDPWIWNHADPEQVWQMFEQTGARYLIPIHYGTFKLSREPMDEPLQRLIAAAGPQADRIVMRHVGAVWTLPAPVQPAHQAIPHRIAGSPAH